MIYAIQRGDAGPVKLGVARDPAQRLSALQTAHDEQLFLRAAWEGERVDERELHARFAASRLRGEWFSPTPEVQTFVDERRSTYEQVALEVSTAKPPEPRRQRCPLWDEAATEREARHYLDARYRDPAYHPDVLAHLRYWSLARLQRDVAAVLSTSCGHASVIARALREGRVAPATQGSRTFAI